MKKLLLFTLLGIFFLSCFSSFVSAVTTEAHGIADDTGSAVTSQQGAVICVKGTAIKIVGITEMSAVSGATRAQI